jgi:hypothetical protein
LGRKFHQKIHKAKCSPTEGWPDAFVKISPKMCPNPSFVNICGKSSPKYGLFLIFQKISKVNNRPIGENSSDLVTRTNRPTVPAEMKSNARVHSWWIRTEIFF